MSAKTMRDALYEEPGPKTRRKMVIGTVFFLVLLVALAAWVVYRFWFTGQLSAKYWELFSWRTTWRYLFKGLEGTFAVALTAAALSLVLGMLLMLGRTSHFRALSAVCAVLTNVLRGVPSLLFIYFFFFAMPNLGIKMPAFWMLCIPVTLAASGVLAEVFRAGVNARASWPDRGGPLHRPHALEGQDEDRAPSGDPIRHPIAHQPARRRCEGHGARVCRELS